MKLRKMNISPWLMLGMAVTLMAACLMIAAAPALARYQTKSDATTQLQARPLEQIYLGQMVTGTDENDEKVFASLCKLFFCFCTYVFLRL